MAHRELLPRHCSNPLPFVILAVHQLVVPRHQLHGTTQREEPVTPPPGNGNVRSEYFPSTARDTSIPNRKSTRSFLYVASKRPLGRFFAFGVRAGIEWGVRYTASCNEEWKYFRVWLVPSREHIRSPLCELMFLSHHLVVFPCTSHLDSRGIYHVPRARGSQLSPCRWHPGGLLVTVPSSQLSLCYNLDMPYRTPKNRNALRRRGAPVGLCSKSS